MVGAHLQGFWFSRSETGLKILHFLSVLRWCWSGSMFWELAASGRWSQERTHPRSEAISKTRASAVNPQTQRSPQPPTPTVTGSLGFQNKTLSGWTSEGGAPLGVWGWLSHPGWKPSLSLSLTLGWARDETQPIFYNSIELMPPTQSSPLSPGDSR